MKFLSVCALSLGLLLMNVSCTEKSLFSNQAEYAVVQDDFNNRASTWNQGDLFKVFGQEMTDHEYVAKDVTCTTYEDGTKVYVNYGYDDFTAPDGTAVPARDYSVTR